MNHFEKIIQVYEEKALEMDILHTFTIDSIGKLIQQNEPLAQAKEQLMGELEVISNLADCHTRENREKVKSINEKIRSVQEDLKPAYERLKELQKQMRDFQVQKERYSRIAEHAAYRRDNPEKKDPSAEAAGIVAEELR